MRRLAVAALLGAALGGCQNLGYENAIGYRSRQAVLQDDPSPFPELMAEAAEAEPKSRLDNPKKTVLTHYLDLAGHPDFLPTVEGWREKGWVDEDMVCPVYRAHFAAWRERDPEAARRSARICLDRARAAAAGPDAAPTVRLCLHEAPFLTRTSTAALGPYLAPAVDPKEPPAFRRGLIEGLTVRTHFGPRERWGVTSTITADAKRARVRAEARDWAARLGWVLDALEDEVPAPELAIASARGALEVEAVFTGQGKSFLATYADSDRPERRALAWAWVRAMKPRAPVERLAGLGLWDRGREPAGDAYWYLCHGEPARDAGGPLGPRWTVDAATARAAAPLDASSPALDAVCAGRPRRLGPYPLERTARAVATAKVAKSVADDARVVIRIRTRETLRD